MDFVSQLNRFLEPLRIKVRNMICKGILSFVDDSNGIQLVQVDLMKDETKDNVERIQNYGFTSNPKSDAESLIVFLKGNRDNALCIAIDDSRYRIKNLPDGAVCLYDNDGNYVKLTESNGIEIEAPNEKVTIKASGDIEIGNSNLKKLVNEEFESVFNNHTHNYTTPLHPGSVAPTLTPNSSLTSLQMTTKVKAE